MANNTLFWSFFVGFCASLWLTTLCPLWLFSLFLCAFCAFLWLKNLFNQRNPRLNISSFSSCLRGEKIREISVNPWLINDLRACKALYNCRGFFTNQTFYAKQSQFPKKSNERNLFNNSRL